MNKWRDMFNDVWGNVLTILSIAFFVFLLWLLGVIIKLVLEQWGHV
jgi:hypothetical protein